MTAISLPSNARARLDGIDTTNWNYEQWLRFLHEVAETDRTLAKQTFDALRDSVFAAYSAMDHLTSYDLMWLIGDESAYHDVLVELITTTAEFTNFVVFGGSDLRGPRGAKVIGHFRKLAPTPKDWQLEYTCLCEAEYAIEDIATLWQHTDAPFREWYDAIDWLPKQFGDDFAHAAGYLLLRDICLRKMHECLEKDDPLAR